MSLSWSSTTNVTERPFAWNSNLSSGAIEFNVKSNPLHVWPGAMTP